LNISLLFASKNMITDNQKSIVQGESRETRKRNIFWWARILVTAVLAIFLLDQIRGELYQIKLQLVQPLYLVLAMITVITAITCSVWLWKLLLLANNKPGFFVLSAHYLLGLFYNNFLPGGIGGDIVRTGALVQGGQRLIVAANSVLMSRLAGLWGIVLLAGITIPIYSYETGAPLALPLILGSLGAFIFTVLLSAFLFGAPLSFLVMHLPARWQRWHNELRSYRSHPKLLLSALLLAICIQVLAVVVNLFVAMALGLSVSFLMLLVSIPLINLITLLPISIGGFGVRETIYFYMLSRFGVSAVEAVVLSLAVYLLIALVSALGAAVSQLWVPRNGRSK
jgi:uncharacterized membrane protein YbhN (UPF0104 family)